MIKPLNVCRDCTSLGVFNSQYIYAIEGRNRTGFIHSIERFDTNDEDSGWMKLPLTESHKAKTPMGGSWCIQKNPETFLIVGGTQRFDGHSSDEIWELNAYTGEAKKHPKKLPVQAELYSPAILYKTKYYQFTYCYYNPEYFLVTYNTVTGCFEVKSHPLQSPYLYD